MNSKKIVFLLLTMIVATGLVTFIVNKYRKPLSAEMNPPVAAVAVNTPLKNNEDTRVDCFIKGQEKLNLNSTNLIKLCGKISSSKPVDCFIDAQKRIISLNETEIIELCN